MGIPQRDPFCDRGVNGYSRATPSVVERVVGVLGFFPRFVWKFTVSYSPTNEPSILKYESRIVSDTCVTSKNVELESNGTGFQENFSRVTKIAIC